MELWNLIYMLLKKISSKAEIYDIYKNAKVQHSDKNNNPIKLVKNPDGVFGEAREYAKKNPNEKIFIEIAGNDGLVAGGLARSGDRKELPWLTIEGLMQSGRQEESVLREVFHIITFLLYGETICSFKRNPASGDQDLFMCQDQMVRLLLSK